MSSIITLENYKLNPANIPTDLEGDRYKDLKKKCIKPEHREAVKASWNRLLVSMEEELNKITGPDYIPEIDFKSIAENGDKFPQQSLDLLKDRGCMIIRDVVPSEQAIEWKNKVVNYTQNHKDITGIPNDDPYNYFVHWTQSQVEARSHPRMVQLMKAVGRTYSNYDANSLVDMDSLVVYADRVRIRRPGITSTLNLHVDSSSIERWEDDDYRAVYSEIFEGRWEDWDPYVIEKRIKANQDLYDSMSANGSTCSVFRSFQGWLALSEANCGEGTIRLLPNVKHVMSYILLRPFFWDDSSNDIDVESAKFPGATPGSGQFMAYDENIFPHLNHKKSVVGIPYVKPGDFVLWHSDLPHEVDKYHTGEKDSSVMFISHNPLCEYNILTLKDARDTFLAGKKPLDFVYELKESPDESAYDDRGKVEHVLTDEGLEALGLKKFDTDDEKLTPGQKKIREISNGVLFGDK